MDDCKELALEVKQLSSRMAVMETRREEFVTHREMERALGEITREQTKVSSALDNLCGNFDSFREAHDKTLIERAQAEKEERFERMQMLREQHAAEMKEREDQSFINTLKRGSIYFGLVLTLLGILSALIGGILWLIQHNQAKP